MYQNRILQRKGHDIDAGRDHHIRNSTRLPLLGFMARLGFCGTLGQIRRESAICSERKAKGEKGESGKTSRSGCCNFFFIVEFSRGRFILCIRMDPT